MITCVNEVIILGFMLPWFLRLWTSYLFSAAPRWHNGLNYLEKMWHPWIPRKAFSMLWLTLSSGLPVGSWRARMGLPSHCQVCNSGEEDLIEHTPFWVHVDQTCVDTLGSTLGECRENVLMGEIEVPCGSNLEREMAWDLVSKYEVNLGTPWDILWVTLLWHIRC